VQDVSKRSARHVFMYIFLMIRAIVNAAIMQKRILNTLSIVNTLGPGDSKMKP